MLEVYCKTQTGLHSWVIVRSGNLEYGKKFVNPNFELNPATRARALYVLLAGTFLMWGGFFMVIPMIGLHFINDLGWAASSIGLILAVRQFGQQGLTVFGGALADRFGVRGLILAGLLVRAVGFALMGYATDFGTLMLANLLAALGGALFEAPRNAAIAALTEDSNRAKFYALGGVVGNLGMTIGPLVGTLLFKTSFTTVALVGAACYVLTLLLTSIFLPNVRTSSGNTSDKPLAGLGVVFKDSRFVLFTVFLMGYWLIWSQFSIAISLAAVAVAHNKDAISWVYTLNALMSVVLQYPVSRFLEGRVKPMQAVVIGMAVMALGIGSLAFANNVVLFLTSLVLLSFGGVIAAPSVQTTTAELANPKLLGSYFGVNALSLAVGGGLGNLVGGTLYQTSLQLELPWLPWVVFAGVGFLSTIGLAFLNARLSTQQQRANQTNQ
jgi:MFS transporter, DHA1 family, multidrug resistance protein